MLSRLNTLKDFKLRSLDGEIGSVNEFYFDDRHWVIRYLVANTGRWLIGRQVLLAPYALLGVDCEGNVSAIDLTHSRSRTARVEHGQARFPAV